MKEREEKRWDENKGEKRGKVTIEEHGGRIQYYSDICSTFFYIDVLCSALHYFLLFYSFIGWSHIMVLRLLIFWNVGHGGLKYAVCVLFIWYLFDLECTLSFIRNMKGEIYSPCLHKILQLDSTRISLKIFDFIIASCTSSISSFEIF